jgi:Ala-tRNA(Pro) deacylase
MATRRILEFLDGNHVSYAVIHHPAATAAQRVAESMHLPGKFLVKTVVVKLDGRLALAVVPAVNDVDLTLLGRASGTNHVELAEKADFVDRFADCQLGAMPPFGNLFGIDAYVDRNIAKLDKIAFNAGTHTDAIAMSFADYRRLAHPRLVKIATEPCDSQHVVVHP